jgi:hypothetical protein
LVLKNEGLSVYLLSDVDEFCPENAELSLDSPARPAAYVIFPPERKPRKMSAVRKRLLDSISDYLYSRSQKVQTAEERDGFTLALAIMDAVRHDQPEPFESACYRAFGSSLTVYLKRRADRQWHQHQELVECIPDYDPQADKRLKQIKAEKRLKDADEERDSGPVAPGTPIAWPMHRLPPAEPAQPKPLRAPPQEKRRAAKRLPQALG